MGPKEGQETLQRQGRSKWPQLCQKDRTVAPTDIEEKNIQKEQIQSEQ